MKTMIVAMTVAVLGIMVCGCTPKKEQGAAKEPAAAEKAVEKAATNAPATAEAE